MRGRFLRFGGYLDVRKSRSLDRSSSDGPQRDFGRHPSRRDVRVCVRFSTAEFATLFARVGRAAGNMSEYVRRVALGRRVPARVDVATAEGLIAILAALRCALAMRELPAREAAVRSVLVHGERVLAALLGPQGRSQ